MAWDGIRRRSEDSGYDSPEVILARIDERTENMEKNFDKHVANFDLHVEKDEKNFSGLYKWVFIGIGIISTLQFVILATKH